VKRLNDDEDLKENMDEEKEGREIGESMIAAMDEDYESEEDDSDDDYSESDEQVLPSLPLSFTSPDFRCLTTSLRSTGLSCQTSCRPREGKSSSGNTSRTRLR